MLQQTRGHVNLWYLICEFEDDDDPAHPEKVITVRSIRRAFPSMSRHNAEYLLIKTVEYLAAGEAIEEAITLTMAMKLITKTLQFAKRTAEQVELIYAEVMIGRNLRVNAALDSMTHGGLVNNIPGGVGGNMMPTTGHGGIPGPYGHAGSSHAPGGYPGSHGHPGPGGHQMHTHGNHMAIPQAQPAGVKGTSVYNSSGNHNAEEIGSGITAEELNGVFQSHLGRMFSYLRDRNDWMDQRMIEQDKRFERIDRNCAAIMEYVEREQLLAAEGRVENFIGPDGRKLSKVEQIEKREKNEEAGLC